MTEQDAIRKDAAAMCAFTAKHMLLAASLINRMQATATCSQDNAYWQLAIALSEELSLIGHGLGAANTEMLKLTGLSMTPVQGGMIQ